MFLKVVVFSQLICHKSPSSFRKAPGGDNFVVDVAALAAECGAGVGVGGGDARVAPRQAQWPQLDAAKAQVAAAAQPESGAVAAPVRRRRKEGPVVVGSSDIFVKAGLCEDLLAQYRKLRIYNTVEHDIRTDFSHILYNFVHLV